MTLRLSLLGLLAFLLLAATFPFPLGFLDAFTVPDQEQFEENYDRWRQMDPEKRETYRQLWEKYQGFTEAKRERLVARWSTLQRIRERSEAARTTSDPAALLEALQAELNRASAVVRNRVRAGGGDPDEARRALQQLNRERITAFLGHLVEGGHLEAAERESILALDPEELSQRCLKLRKQELIAWIEAGEPELAQQMRHLDPVDTERRARQQRRERGFVGPVARLMDRKLQAAGPDRRRMQQAFDEDDLRTVRAVLAPHVRAVLADLEVPEGRAEALLELPHAQLERHLNALATEALGSRARTERGAGREPVAEPARDHPAAPAERSADEGAQDGGGRR